MTGCAARSGSVRVLGDDLRLANDGSLQGRPKTSAVPCTTRALGRQRDLEIIHFPCRLESQFQEHTCRLEDARKEVKAVASFRPGQQHRPSAESPQEENAARRHLPGDEAAPILREA